jgi:TolB protein
MIGRRARAGLLLAACACGAASVSAQWTNRYPRVTGWSHHVYLEGYELPLLTNGPIDAAPSSDGTRLVFASRGWLWLYDIAGATAMQLTNGAGVDSRPAWSPDGTSIAFVRDDGRSLRIMVINSRSGAESELVTDRAILLDPAFAPDGQSLYYSSGVAGDLDLWRLDLKTRQPTRVTTLSSSLELHPMPTRDGEALIYLAKVRGGTDQVRRRSLATGEFTVLASGSILSMTRGAVSPDSRTLALTWPTQDGSELLLTSAQQPGATVQLLRDPTRIPLTPAFSADGKSLWFSYADAQQRMQLARVPASGGPRQDVAVKQWNWKQRTARVRIITRRSSGPEPVGARLAVSTGEGHPLLPDSGQVRFDGQNGVNFFYSTGTTELTVPAGDVIITAVQGIATPPAVQRVSVAAGETRTVSMVMTPVWNARAAGWLSGEHHFHLNYGGPYRLEPAVLPQMARAEALDVLTPMLANLAQRFDDQALFSYRQTTSPPWITWAQEVRAHFFGHIGLINSRGLFWPWIWGPGYDVNARDDRPNADALAWTGANGGINTYVHPVPTANPFGSPAGLRSIPLGFVADAVQGRINAIELACLWSDERGTTDLWYRVLNAGVPMVLTAGTDAMNNLYRTMAIGTTRVYVKPQRRDDLASYFSALKAGRSVASSGPMLELLVGGAGPGEVVPRGDGSARWQLAVHAAMPLDTVEIIVNGAVVERLAGLAAPGSQRYSGTVTLPPGGWIAARASGPATTGWPAMDSYPFAHTSPVWITEPAARAAAARDLLRALDVADQALEIGYTGADHPRLLAHYAAARRVLNAWLPQ